MLEQTEDRKLCRPATGRLLETQVQRKQDTTASGLTPPVASDAVPLAGRSSELRPLTEDDGALFAQALSGLREPISDASFFYSLIWAEPLGTRVAVIEKHLCLFSSADGDLSMLLPPMAVGESSARLLRRALGACFEVMDSANGMGAGVERSRIEYVSDEMLGWIRGAGRLGLVSESMPGDYIYDRRSLADLAGGGLKEKRRLRSKFMRDCPDASTHDLTAADIAECEGVLEAWSHAAEVRHEGEADESLRGVDILRQRDVASTKKALRLATGGMPGLVSMGLRAGGKLVGFTIGEWMGGERVDGRMGVVAVEKTLPGVVGAAQYIYSEFCRSRFEGAAEINAGDDCGFASLRFTKQSYRPTRMLAKHMVTRRNAKPVMTPGRETLRLLTFGRPSSRRPEPAAGSVGMTLATIRRADLGDIKAIARVEQAAFTDAGDRFNPRQVRRLVTNPRAIVAVAELEGEVVGWCVGLIRSHTRWRSGRVYSVAVTPEQSGRGVGRKLLSWMLGSLAERDVRRVYLEVRAENRAALELYRSLGFVPIAHLQGYYGAGTDGLRMRRIAPALGH